MRSKVLIITLAAGVGVSVPAADAQMWVDVTDETIGETAEWSNKVELADVDGDGDVDILFANGGNYSVPGAPQKNRVFLNTLDTGTVGFEEATDEIFGPQGDLARVLKVRDVSGDGIADIIVGGGHQTQTRLYFGEGGRSFREVTATHLPAVVTSMGDLEIGDVDGDGDLDLVAADWGAGDALNNDGGPVILWENSGDGHFTDASAKLPTDAIEMSWDLELIDVDNDYDLDLLVSCKMCVDSRLYHNDGAGTFTSVPFDPGTPGPQGVENNYEFEWLDANGDGFLDVVTINDGELDDPSSPLDLRERLFLADGRGGFTNATDELWPEEANIGADDNAIVVLDADSDGDPDFLIAALGPEPDRLMINDGKGNLTLMDDVFGGAGTPGTLGIAVADLNGDGRLDVVQSQGELADDERVYFGADIAPDSAGPVVSLVSAHGDEVTKLVRARVYDNKTPVMPHDFQSVEVVTSAGTRVAMQWTGEALWRADVSLPDGTTYEVCATDAAGNETCRGDNTDDDKTDDVRDADSSSGCQSVPGSGPLSALLLFVLIALAQRRRTQA